MGTIEALAERNPDDVLPTGFEALLRYFSNEDGNVAVVGECAATKSAYWRNRRKIARRMCGCSVRVRSDVGIISNLRYPDGVGLSQRQ